MEGLKGKLFPNVFPRTASNVIQNWFGHQHLPIIEWHPFGTTRYYSFYANFVTHFIIKVAFTIFCAGLVNNSFRRVKRKFKSRVVCCLLQTISVIFSIWFPLRVLWPNVVLLLVPKVTVYSQHFLEEHIPEDYLPDLKFKSCSDMVKLILGWTEAALAILGILIVFILPLALRLWDTRHGIDDEDRQLPSKSSARETRRKDSVIGRLVAKVSPFTRKQPTCESTTDAGQLSESNANEKSRSIISELQKRGSALRKLLSREKQTTPISPLRHAPGNRSETHFSNTTLSPSTRESWHDVPPLTAQSSTLSREHSGGISNVIGKAVSAIKGLFTHDDDSAAPMPAPEPIAPNRFRTSSSKDVVPVGCYSSIEIINGSNSYNTPPPAAHFSSSVVLQNGTNAIDEMRRGLSALNGVLTQSDDPATLPKQRRNPKKTSARKRSNVGTTDRVLRSSGSRSGERQQFPSAPILRLQTYTRSGKPYHAPLPLEDIRMDR